MTSCDIMCSSSFLMTTLSRKKLLLRHNLNLPLQQLEDGSSRSGTCSWGAETPTSFQPPVTELSRATWSPRSLLCSRLNTLRSPCCSSDVLQTVLHLLWTRSRPSMSFSWLHYGSKNVESLAKPRANNIHCISNICGASLPPTRGNQGLPWGLWQEKSCLQQESLHKCKHAPCAIWSLRCWPSSNVFIFAGTA